MFDVKMPLLASAGTQPQHDIALTNLLCAAGLPGAENLEPQQYLKILDDFTERVHWKTVRNFRQFEKWPWEYHYSMPYYRMLVLVTVLQKECGVHYDLVKIPEEVHDRTRLVDVHRPRGDAGFHG